MSEQAATVEQLVVQVPEEEARRQVSEPWEVSAKHQAAALQLEAQEVLLAQE